MARQPTPNGIQKTIIDHGRRLARLESPQDDTPVWAAPAGTATTSTAFVQLAVSAPFRRGASLRVTLLVDVAGGAGTGEGRLRLASPVALTGTAVTGIPAGANQLVDVTLDVPSGWTYETRGVVYVEYRSTSAATTVTARVVDSSFR